MNNNVQAFGNLVADPEQKTIGNDLVVTEFRIGNNIKNKKGNKTLWFRCSVWNKGLGEVAMKYLKKGLPVFVSGELDVQEWEKDGVNNFSLQINVEKLRLLGGKNDEAVTTEPAAEPAPKATAKPAGKTTTSKKTNEPANDGFGF